MLLFSFLLVVVLLCVLQYAAAALGMMAGKASYAAFATLGEVLKDAARFQVTSDAASSDGLLAILNFVCASGWSLAALKATVALEKSWGGKALIDDREMD